MLLLLDNAKPHTSVCSIQAVKKNFLDSVATPTLQYVTSHRRSTIWSSERQFVRTSLSRWQGSAVHHVTMTTEGTHPVKSVRRLDKDGDYTEK